MISTANKTKRSFKLMKRAYRFLFASILSLCVLSFGVSASGSPAGTLLPDNVTGFGTTMGTSPLDGIMTGQSDTGITGTTQNGGHVATVPPVNGDTSSADQQTRPAEPSKTMNEVSEGIKNYALASNGAKYVIVRLSADGNTEEAVSEYFGGTDDSGNKRLNDGAFGDVESASKSVAVGGSGRTFRYKFDLGTNRSGINRIVFKNIQDSYSADPLNNRSFDEAKFKIMAGDSESGLKTVPFTLEKKQLGDNRFSFDVTLNVASGASGRYFYLEAGPVENAFVLSVDEIQIFGESASPSEPSGSTSGTEIKSPATGDAGSAAYAFTALVSSVVVAALILYRKKKVI